MSILDQIRVSGGNTDKSEYSGMDQEDRCFNREHFQQYPWPIEYSYNSRGFRDREWPNDFNQLKNSIWCVGDSFTLGTGSPWSHTWPQVLEQLVHQPTINCSMDGASNEWISNTAVKILNVFNPDNMIIMWSYIHRRTNLPLHVNRTKLPNNTDQYQNDLKSRLHYVHSTDEEDIENLKQCINRVRHHQQKRIIHASIPHFAPLYCKTQGRAAIECQLHWISYFENLDWARDGHHFDIKTSQWVAEQVQPLLFLVGH